MDLQPIQFGTSVSTHGAHISAETSENLYLEEAPKGAKCKYVLMGTPGLAFFALTAAGSGRGMIAMGAYVFAVVGNRCYRISQTGTVQDLHDIVGTGYVALATNGIHVWCATETKLYALNALECIELPESGFVGVASQDGYMLAVKGGSGEWFISGIDDATTIAALDFTDADAFQDNNKFCLSDDSEFVALGGQSLEFYRNTGASAFPFERSHVLEYGCVSGHSAARADGAILWLGAARQGGIQVYSMQGAQPQPIAPPWVVALIEARASPETAKGICFQRGGHSFYALVFSDLTLLYNIGTGLWSKLVSDGLGRWRIGAHCWQPEWKTHLVLDYATGAISELSDTVYTEGGDVLRRRATSAPLFFGGLGFITHEFVLDIDAGVGLATGQGSDPQAILDWSDDGGRTWSTELWRSFGAIGEYTRRARWHHLGRSRNRTFRITISDPVPVRIAGAYVRVEQLAA